MSLMDPDFDCDWSNDPWTDDDEAALEEFEADRRQRRAEEGEY